MTKERSERGANGSRLSGWGRHSAPGSELLTENLERGSMDVPLSRGLGRSYGDSSLPPADKPVALNTTLADRILSFDTESGLLRAEAGLSLAELNRLFLPRGWFTPVSPGTQYVTLGGMVAADVHGKNQHVDGDFGDHVTRLKMRVADGRVLSCGPEEHADLFFGSIGGMGLLGHILEVEFVMRRVPSQWIWQETERVPNIDAFEEALSAAAKDWPMTVGWIDCVAGGASLGRGILMKGRWATASEAPKHAPRPKPRPKLPFDLPEWALGRLSVRAFNELYYRKHFRKETRGLVDPQSFFYPLDILRDWNRMYGRRGFTQWQGLLPRSAKSGAARRMLEILSARGGASFLAVIKDCDKAGVGTLSFPAPGITLALDIPMRDDTQALIDALNQQLLREGGRIYLAKDSLTRAEDFRAMEPRLEEFGRLREAWDPEHKLKSAQSIRLLGDSA
jgi:FAD/FMN-containing dehydrogenase